MFKKILIVAGIALFQVTPSFADTNAVTPYTPANQVPVTGDSPQQRSQLIQNRNNNSETVIRRTPTNEVRKREPMTPVERQDNFNKKHNEEVRKRTTDKDRSTPVSPRYKESKQYSPASDTDGYKSPSSSGGLN